MVLYQKTFGLALIPSTSPEGRPCAQAGTDGPHHASGMPLSGIAVGFGGRGHVLPKQGGKGTVIRNADPEANLEEGQRRLRQQLLRVLDPAREHVLVGRLPGCVLE